MKAIAAEFTPVWSDWTAPEEAVGVLPDRFTTDSDKPTPRLQLSHGDNGAPPFWTWFIENPRRSTA